MIIGFDNFDILELYFKNTNSYLSQELTNYRNSVLDL